MTLSRLEPQALLTAPGAEFEIVEETVRGIPLRNFRDTPRSLREVLLHSRSLRFRRPENGREIKVTAPLDAAYTRAASIFGKTA